MSYDFSAFESRWQARWAERDEHLTPADPKRKFYCLEMFAYPSGDIHMGHFRNYSVGDVVARLRRMQGFDLMHPFGWDAFGLPAEEAAIKRGVHPRDWTLDNIEVSRATLRRCGISYDWSREIVTCRPDYYRWNQWMFLLLYRRGLAYRKVALVNWCPGCKTVLANEQVEGGLCWKCESAVMRRELEQWFVKITAYADRLLAGLDRLTEWPRNIREIQRHWIGRSEGARISFRAESVAHTFEVFTTRPDTLFGVSFLAIAPEHPWARLLAAGTDRAEAVNAYIDRAVQRSDIERASTVRVQDGVFTGTFALHPATGDRIPVWVADYVLAHYGTGVVMGVPGHDERDFAFARRYELPVKVVIRPEGTDSDLDVDAMGAAWTGPGTMVHSGMFDGTPSEKGKVKVATWLRNNGLGGPEVTFRLHDWLISRQRYWGTPIPMIRCGTCGDVPVPEEQLPVLLPEGIQDYRPKGRSPLADVPGFLNTTCPRCGAAAERDADTMDTFIDSSWYHLRYPDPHNATAAFRKEEVARWLPIDLYIGGPEHATGHLLYFRFITMVLHDEGLIPVEEPAIRLFNHGMVLDGEGKKMSKSKGNLVAPGDMLARYGVDASRVAMCFFAPSADPIVWKEEGVQGAARFLRRVYEFVVRNADRVKAAPTYSSSLAGDVDEFVREARGACHRALRNMSRAVETELAFNTVVSDLMIAHSDLSMLTFVPLAEWQQRVAPDRDFSILKANPGRGLLDSDANNAAFADAVRVFVKVLAPMAPHLGEELHSMLGGTESVFRGPWPSFDPKALVQDTVEIPVQINGKVRARIVVPAGAKPADLERAALESEEVRPFLAGVSVRKVIVVPGRIVNIVVG